MTQERLSARPTSRRSIAGLNAANFFSSRNGRRHPSALNGYLRESGWRYDAIGFATALAGLDTLLFQTPAGLLTDRISQRRMLFGAAALLTGICFVLIPAARGSSFQIDSLLFTAGATQSFFAPLLGALALALVGHQ